jgi:transcriptional regulator with XRE-family HTH domain
MVPSTKSATHRPLSEQVASSLAGTLRAERLQSGLTQEGLAAASSISVQLVRRLEAGTSNPTLGTLEAVATSLGLKVSDLLARSSS